MKKFIFSLEKVLGLKSQMLDVLINDLMKLQNQLNMVEKEIDRLRNWEIECNQSLNQQLMKGINSQKIMSQKLYIHSVGQQVKAMLHKKELCEVAVAQKKDELIQLKSDISGLEKLKDKQKQEYQKSAQKAQELVIEEFVSQTYNVG